MDVPSVARLAFATGQSERLAVEPTWKELVPVMCEGKDTRHQSRVVSSDQLNKNNENNTRQKSLWNLDLRLSVSECRACFLQVTTLLVVVGGNLSARCAFTVADIVSVNHWTTPRSHGRTHALYLLAPVYSPSVMRLKWHRQYQQSHEVRVPRAHSHQITRPQRHRLETRVRLHGL